MIAEADYYDNIDRKLFEEGHSFEKSKSILLSIDTSVKDKSFYT